jgi:hypothetical protein
MYDSLTTKELTVLQDVLFGATEEAYGFVNVQDGDDTVLERYHPLHRELALMFIEAGEELLTRLDQVMAA